MGFDLEVSWSPGKHDNLVVPQVDSGVHARLCKQTHFLCAVLEESKHCVFNVSTPSVNPGGCRI